LSNLNILSKNHKYEVTFDRFEDYLNAHHFYLCDKFFEKRIEIPKNRTYFISASEENKVLGKVEEVILNLLKMGMRKDDTLIVIGGGAVQDLGTLIASIYLRGVRWQFIPTTLAAMGDSSIGGKSSINTYNAKNIIGNFYPPDKIWIDARFVETLPSIERIAGLAEIIKICFARSFEDFTQSLNYIAIKDGHFGSPNILELVKLSLSCKKFFIEEDEYDTGIRKLLNFGHSFGHALEKGTNYSIPHGVAVLIGMIAAVKHPDALRSPATAKLQAICAELLSLIFPEIQLALESVDYMRFSEALRSDKKNTRDFLVLILPDENGLTIKNLPFANNSIGIAVATMQSTIEEVRNDFR